MYNEGNRVFTVTLLETYTTEEKKRTEREVLIVVTLGYIDVTRGKRRREW